MIDQYISGFTTTFPPLKNLDAWHIVSKIQNHIEDALKKLEDINTKNKGKPAPLLPEFGTAEDFPLQQAINRLKGRPVLVSKTLTERKPEDTAKATQ